jgi:hypothetical protein
MRGKVLLMLLMVILSSTCWAATERDGEEDEYTGFHLDLYNQALKNKVMSNAAKCEAINEIVTGNRKSSYLLSAIDIILREPDNKFATYMLKHGDNEHRLFVEYELAYNALRNLGYGSLSVMKKNKLVSSEQLLEWYAQSGCEKLDKQSD